MKVTDLDFELPESFIALTPTVPRDACRLLVLHRGSGMIEHRIFRDLPGYLREGDLLILNDTRVLPARLTARKKTGGKIDILLVKEQERNVWEILSKGKYTGRVDISDVLSGEIVEGRSLRLSADGDAQDALWKAGMMPLPPYIRREPSDADGEWYQTVYAERSGSIAAPTAGLHFSDELIGEIGEKGVIIRFLTLHVGTGTFKPVKVDDVEAHTMDSEHFEIGPDLIEAIHRARNAGKRVVTVGTTTTRAIEGYLSGRYNPADAGNRSYGGPGISQGSPVAASAIQGKVCGSTDIFIYPGYEFRAVDSLIANFHLPRSTPLMLTSALSGTALLLDAYRDAIGLGYRFFSYGDAMLIL